MQFTVMMIEEMVITFINYK